ncbi:hypothetical protein GCM10011490_09180 [Pseudoclavibacter endophyticus]|nr:hypothetical protein GCM10011490_09180 [Pseudoclavibacter endophyticus]
MELDRSSAGRAGAREADIEARLREDFPYRDGRVYLNSAGAGLPWRGVAGVAAEHYAQIARLGADAQPQWHELAARTRGRVAAMLRVGVDEIAFLRSTTEVMNLAAASLDWSAGDEVVYPADDFPSVVLPWSSALAAGAHPIAVAVPDESSRTDALVDAITQRTRMVAVTHVNATTGTRVDLDRLGDACRAVDALLVVDGIEALGAIPVDLARVDVYGSGVFKWLLSGFGTAIGVFRERTAAHLTPAYRGYANPAPSPRFEYSEPNFPGLAVLDATLAYLDDLGWATVHERVRMLTDRVSDIVDSLGLDVVTPASRAGIFSFRVPDAAGLVARLSDRGIDVVAKQGLVRVSPHVYTSHRDIDRFERALADAIA